MSMVDKKMTHIISHTHWDREWYIPFQNYRFRLVKTIDRCIDVFSKKIGFKHFNFDGQTVILEDYLEIKPQNRHALEELIQNGKIGIGPWYLQASPWLQTGEGIVRNLLFGHRICRKFDTDPVNVGYVPDQFLLFAQLPQIFQGFGIQSSAFCRVIQDQYEKNGINTEFHWKSPDGSKITAFHLRYGYGMAGFLPNNPEMALNQLVFARGKISGAPNATNQYLMFNGSDHTDPDEVLPAALQMWNEEQELVEEFGEIKHSTWKDYVDAFWAEEPELKTISGELSGNKYHFAAKGVFSNRMPIKQENFALHYLLEDYAEPMNSIAYLMGNESQRGFIDTAWKYLLRNQPHDSIWGASPDPIIEDVWTRFRWSRQIADEVFRRSLQMIVQRIKKKTIDDGDQEHNKCSRYSITIFNPSPWYRSDVVTGTFSVEPDDMKKTFVLRDSNDHLLPAKITPRDPTSSDRLLYRTFVPSHGSLPKNLFQFTFLARGVPPLGYETFTFEEESESALESPIEETFVNAQDNFLENNVIRVTVNKNGSITILDKRSNKKFEKINYFSDTGNKGCNYEYIPLKNDKAVTTLGSKSTSKLITACSAYSEIKISIPFEIPYTVDEDMEKRIAETREMPVDTFIRVYPGNNPRVDIRTEFVNTAKWHQIRAIFPTDLNVKEEFVHGHYLVSKRPVDTPWDFEGKYATTGVYPQHKFMGLYDPRKEKGLAILNRGLPAYETYRRDNHEIDIALTLLRAQGQWVVHLNRDPNIETPDAQWLNKKFVAEYSIIPMSKDWLDMNLMQQAEEYTNPFRCEEHWDVFRLQRYQPEHDLPPLFSLVEILDGSVSISAIKEPEFIDNGGKENRLIVRLFNYTDSAQNVKLKTGLEVISCQDCDLNEKPKQHQSKITVERIDLEDDDWMNDVGLKPSSIEFSLDPHKIATLMIKFGRKW